MDKVFVYGMSVEGANFTDREKETRRLTLNFENGINTILISPRRMGKTSLVKHAIGRLKDREDILIVYLDIYECRSEYDFYNKFAAAVIQQTSTRMDQWLDNAKEFLLRLTPKLSFSPDPGHDMSLSLGITPSTHTPEEILSLPEVIAKKRGKHVVVCIDEFQQIGEMPDSLSIQKRLRGIWQHQSNCSYCLFGSKKHLMTMLFQDKKMPFYMFGEMMYLGHIPTEDWTEYIKGRFASRGKTITEAQCKKICEYTDTYSSYVQQLAWNVFAESGPEVSDKNIDDGLNELMQQCNALFQQQISGLSSYQMNMLRAVAAGVHNGFSREDILKEYRLGTKSNITRLRLSLVEKELLEVNDEGLYFADPLFAIWFSRIGMQ